MFAFASLLALASLSLASAASVEVVAGPEWNTLKTEMEAQPGAKVSKLQALADPPVPEGFSLTFGPVNASNEAPGFMGFVFIDSYDVAQCASLCKTRDFDSVGGLCQFFNIFQGALGGNRTSFTCSLYYLTTDAKTAINPGDSTVVISNSRGYSRLSSIPNGSIENLVCTPPAVTCSVQSIGGWVGTSDNATVLDTAAIVHDPTLAHFGSGAISLGSISGRTSASGTETFSRIPTTRGRNYTLGFFHSSVQKNAANATGAIVNATWNGVVIDTISGANNWTFHGHTLLAVGNDTLAFHGGKFPAFNFIDDVFLFLA